MDKRTPHKMNGKGLSVKFSETLGFGSSKRVEQMSQWVRRPAMDRFWDIRDASDENYIVNIFIYIMSSLSSKNLSMRMCRKNQPFLGFVPIETFVLLVQKNQIRKFQTIWRKALSHSFCAWSFYLFQTKTCPNWTKSWSKMGNLHFPISDLGIFLSAPQKFFWM